MSVGLSVERQVPPPQTAAVQQAGVQLWDKRIRVNLQNEAPKREGLVARAGQHQVHK